MPTAVKQLLNKLDLKIDETIKWGTHFRNNHNGIYIVSHFEDINYLPREPLKFKLDIDQVNLWLSNADDLTMDHQLSSIQNISNRLNSFWLPDESILYIGKAEKQTLSTRVRQFYNHNVGKRSPHKGGYWLKLLEFYQETFIHLISSKDSSTIEEKMLQYFIDNVSTTTKSNLRDKELTLPFANLQLRPRVIKNHGFKNHCK